MSGHSSSNSSTSSSNSNAGGTKRKAGSKNAPSHTGSEVISFKPLGSGREVGRSCHLLSIGGKNILLDCGVHPSRTGKSALPQLSDLDLSTIDIVLISHFHLDHVAALPYLMKQPNFKAPVFMTQPTHTITTLMLEDYIRVTSFGHELQAQGPIDRLYTSQDLADCMKRVTVINFHAMRTYNGIRFQALYAGHVLGAAMFMIEVGSTRILYTGDYSCLPDRHLPAAELPHTDEIIDLLICEGTHGVESLGSAQDREQAFTLAVSNIVKAGGKCLIPQFASGRAQELFLILEDYWRNNPSISDIPIYFSSPLAWNCLKAYQSFIGHMNLNIKKVAESGRNPFRFLHITPLDYLTNIQTNEPCVVFASPGMLQSGTSRELFEDWCNDPRNGVVIAGYCTEGTLAHSLMKNKPRQLTRMDGEIVPIACSVDSVTFSAHADYPETHNFISQLRPKNIILVHANDMKISELQKKLTAEFPSIHIQAPPNRTTATVVVTKQKIVKTYGQVALNSYLRDQQLLQTAQQQRSESRTESKLFGYTGGNDTTTASDSDMNQLVRLSDDNQSNSNTMGSEQDGYNVDKWKENEPQHGMIVQGMVVQNKSDPALSLLTRGELLQLVKTINVITQKTSISTTLPVNTVMSLINSILEITEVQFHDPPVNNFTICTFVVMEYITITAAVESYDVPQPTQSMQQQPLPFPQPNEPDNLKEQAKSHFIHEILDITQPPTIKNSTTSPSNSSSSLHLYNPTTKSQLTTYTIRWEANPTTDVLVDCISAIILGAQLNPSAAKLLGGADSCCPVAKSTPNAADSTNAMGDATPQTLIKPHPRHTRWTNEDLFSFIYEFITFYRCQVVRNHHELYNAIAQHMMNQPLLSASSTTQHITNSSLSQSPSSQSPSPTAKFSIAVVPSCFPAFSSRHPTLSRLDYPSLSSTTTNELNEVFVTIQPQPQAQPQQHQEQGQEQQQEQQQEQHQEQQQRQPPTSSLQINSPYLDESLISDTFSTPGHFITFVDSPQWEQCVLLFFINGLYGKIHLATGKVQLHKAQHLISVIKQYAQYHYYESIPSQYEQISTYLSSETQPQATATTNSSTNQTNSIAIGALTLPPWRELATSILTTNEFQLSNFEAQLQQQVRTICYALFPLSVDWLSNSEGIQRDFLSEHTLHSIAKLDEEEEEEELEAPQGQDIPLAAVVEQQRRLRVDGADDDDDDDLDYESMDGDLDAS